MASTAHKTVILRKTILSKNDVTEFDVTLFAVTCQTPDIFRIFWPKKLEDCSLHSQPHRGPCHLWLCEMSNWRLSRGMKAPKFRFKVSIYDYLQIKLPWFHSFSLELWWVRWRPVSVNWVMKRNGHPREPVGQNYFSPLSGTTRLICQWLHSSVAATPHTYNVFAYL